MDNPVARERGALLKREGGVVLDHLLARRLLILRLGSGGELLDASPLFEPLLGLAFEGCCGRRPWEWGGRSEAASAAWQNLSAAIGQRRPWRGELDFPRGEDRRVYTDAWLDPIGEEGFLLSMSDQTVYGEETRRIARENERYQRALWGADFALFDWDVKTGRIHLSSRFHEMTGLGREECGDTISSLVDRLHPDDAPPTRAAFDALAEQRNSCDVEFRIRDGSGRWKWLRGRAHAVWSTDGSVLRVAGSLEDIHERKRAEEAAQLVEKRYRDAIHAARGVAYELRLGDPERGDYYLFMDDRLEEIIGIPSQTLTREAALALEEGALIRHPKFDGDREAFHERFLRGEIDIYQADLHVTDQHGGKKWLSDTAIPVFDAPGGRVIGSLGILQDITDRKTAELALGRQLARMELLNRIARLVAGRGSADQVFEVVLDALSKDLAIDFAAFFSLNGDNGQMVTEHLLPAGFAGLEPGSVHTLSSNDHDRIFSGGDPVVYSGELGESALCSRLGSEGIRSILALPLLTGEVPLGIMAVGRNREDAFSRGECGVLGQLSQHVALALAQQRLREDLERAIEDLKRTQQQLMRQERLRAMGQMASGIAHDINNALAPLTMYPEMLLATETELSPQVRQVLELINHSALNIAQTVARLGELYKTRDNEGERRPVNLNELINRVVHLTRPRWRDIARQQGSEIDVKTRLDPELTPLRLVEGEWRDALTNLVFNAVDAMPEGGEIHITTERAAGGARLVFRDTGEGMSDQTRRQCLEPFFTTKGQQGTGLGLPMVHSILERHGGTIEIDSAPAMGTTFTLFIPETPGEEGDADAGQGDGSFIPLSPSLPVAARLLVVDDDVAVRRALSMSLLREGFDVEMAASGADALVQFEAALAQARPFDAVMTDLGMPGMDGGELAARLRERHPGIPIILLTGWGAHFGRGAQRPPQVDVVLSKPPLMQELRDALRRLLPSP